jgi:hypothetical protein
MRKFVVVLAGAILCLMIFVSVPTHSQSPKGKLLRKANKIQNNYIVVLDDSVVGERGAYSIANLWRTIWPPGTAANSNISTNTRSMGSRSR